MIDAHCHVWSADLARYPLVAGREAQALQPPAYPLESHLARLKTHGIGRAVLVQHVHFHGFDIRYLVDARRHFPDRVAVIGACGESESDAPVRLRAQIDAGVRGVRLRGIDTASWAGSTTMQSLWAMATEAELALCVLACNPGMDVDGLLHLDALCVAHPRAIVVIDHMGLAMPGDRAQSERLIALARHPGVHLKLSAFDKFVSAPPATLRRQLRSILTAFGAERLMWGSDLPVLETSGATCLQDAIDVVRTIPGISGASLDAIFGKTAARLFFD